MSSAQLDDASMHSDLCPANCRLPMLLQVIIGLAEWLAAKEAPVCRQGRGMGCRQDTMLADINQAALGLRIATPQDEDQVVALVGQGVDRAVRQLFPALAGMRSRL